MMTVTEIKTRATERAATEYLRTWKLAGTNGLYLVKSRQTKSGAMHTVQTDTASRVIACTCKRWSYRRPCAHAAAVYRRIQRETHNTAITDAAPVGSASTARGQFYREG